MNASLYNYKSIVAAICYTMMLVTAWELGSVVLLIVLVIMYVCCYRSVEYVSANCSGMWREAKFVFFSGYKKFF